MHTWHTQIDTLGNTISCMYPCTHTFTQDHTPEHRKARLPCSLPCKQENSHTSALTLRENHIHAETHTRTCIHTNNQHNPPPPHTLYRKSKLSHSCKETLPDTITNWNTVVVIIHLFWAMG